MYKLKKDLPNYKAGTAVDDDNKIISEILKDNKLKNEWLEVEKTDEEKRKERKDLLENIKENLERDLEDINNLLTQLK